MRAALTLRTIRRIMITFKDQVWRSFTVIEFLGEPTGACKKYVLRTECLVGFICSFVPSMIIAVPAVYAAITWDQIFICIFFVVSVNRGACLSLRTPRHGEQDAGAKDAAFRLIRKHAAVLFRHIADALQPVAVVCLIGLACGGQPAAAAFRRPFTTKVCVTFFLLFRRMTIFDALLHDKSQKRNKKDAGHCPTSFWMGYITPHARE